MLELFLKKVVKNETYKSPTVEDGFMVRNIKLIRIAALVVFGVSCYWIIIDMLSDSYNLVPISKISVYLQGLSSVFMFFLPCICKKARLFFCRMAFVHYYAIIVFGVGVLTVTRNIEIAEAGAVSSFIGVSVSAFYLFLFTLLPLYKVIDSLFVILSMYVALIVPEIIITSAAYSLFSHIVLCACFTVGYYFMRKNTIESIEGQIKIGNLSNSLTEYSYCDPLTSVLNRRAMNEYFDYIFNNKEITHVGIVLFDVDFFKRYNDFYGHVNGDQALVSISAIAQEQVKKIPGALFFRYGGEEFITIIENASDVIILDTMEKIRSSIWNACLKRNDINEFDRLSVTVGGAIEPIPNFSGDYVVAADNQLFIGKKSKRNRIYFAGSDGNVISSNDVAYVYRNIDAEDMIPGTGDKAGKPSPSQLYESRFEKAVAGNEFVAWCQPKYSAKDGKLVGAEALVRWRNGDGTFISPGEFIPVYERNGLIAKLDEYMFKLICKEQKKRLEKGKPVFPISVNMSRASLFQPGSVERYSAMIKETGVPFELVPLELTESAASDGERIKGLVNALKNEGFVLYLDDFGTGYSSLANLGLLPFDFIKLDKTLIDEIGNRSGDEILKHIIQLAHFLKMNVVAEGVENQTQLEFLTNLDCDIIQGYIFSRPIPYEAYAEKIDEE